MRIGLVVWALYKSKGGLERVGAMLANEMTRRGHKVIIFCQNIPPSAQPVYPLSPSVSSVALDLDTWESLAQAREKVIGCNLDVMCALFSWESLLWMPALMNNTGIPLIISEHNHPDIIENERWNAYERRACLAAADKIHLLTKMYYSLLPSFLQERAVVIPNPVAQPLPIPDNRDQTDRKRILAVGRMVEKHKQFALLLRAFQILAPKFLDWDLCICGDGPDSEMYKQLALDLGIQDRVQFPGMVDNIDDYYANSHIFCIPSRHEGFPLTPLEAQRHGLAAVGFADCSGVNEIIVHGENGLLVPEQTPVALAAALQVLMKNDEIRRVMGLKAQKMLVRYEEQSIMDHWETLFFDAQKLRKKTKLSNENYNEQIAIEGALVEILSRKHPFVRLGCSGLEGELSELKKKFEHAVLLLRHHGIV